MDEEVERTKYALYKKFDTSKLRMNSFTPYVYNKVQKVVTLAAEELNQIKKERKQRAQKQIEKHNAVLHKVTNVGLKNTEFIGTTLNVQSQ